MSETQTITIACKLKVDSKVAKEIDETLSTFAVACDWINQNTPVKLINRTAMQSLVYQDVRAKFGLSANLAIQAIRRVCANRKTAQQKGRKVKDFSPTSISYDARIFSFREDDWTVSIKLLHSRHRIAIEDLTGIRERTNKKPRSKKDKRLGNNWAFYQLRQYLTYKCLLAGVKLVLVNPAYTSLSCHKCLVIGDRRGKKFSCNNCGNKCDADYNGSKNIAALGSLINRPRGTGLFCEIKHEVQYIQLTLWDALGLQKTHA